MRLHPSQLWNSSVHARSSLQTIAKRHQFEKDSNAKRPLGLQNFRPGRLTTVKAESRCFGVELAIAGISYTLQNYGLIEGSLLAGRASGPTGQDSFGHRPSEHGQRRHRLPNFDEKRLRL